MGAEIEGYCHRLVEEQEEALQAALYANAREHERELAVSNRSLVKELNALAYERANRRRD